jgi:hypothetical protein
MTKATAIAAPMPDPRPPASCSILMLSDRRGSPTRGRAAVSSLLKPNSSSEEATFPVAGGGGAAASHPYLTPSGGAPARTWRARATCEIGTCNMKGRLDSCGGVKPIASFGSNGSQPMATSSDSSARAMS